MGYVKGIDVGQMVLVSWDSLVEKDNLARIIDAFVENLDIGSSGIKKSVPAQEGRPPYDPRAMLKLYIYGNKYDIRSSRRLEKACTVNNEVIWLMRGVTPDFRTISDFRKDNVKALKTVFHEFNKKLLKVLDEGFQSLDGSKFQAWNSKDRNFTLSKLDDRLRYLDAKSDEYERQLAAYDAAEEEVSDEDACKINAGAFTREELEEKLRSIAERQEKYRGYLEYMEENGLSQLSLTDADSKLMKNKNGYAVSYNIQTVVESENHLITDFITTNNATDHGLINESMKDLATDGEIIHVVADKGYQEPYDMAEALKNGIVPHVILPDGQDTHELESDYNPVEGAGDLKDNTDHESLRKCIESGVIPTAYEGIIDKIEVRDVRKKVYEFEDDGKGLSEEQMIARAAEGFFVRDIDRDLVYCPAGEILRKKSDKAKGSTVYANKLACKHCPYKEKCMKNKTSKKYPFKEVEFGDKVTEKICKTWNAECGDEVRKEHNVKSHYETMKKVIITLRPDRQMMDQRKSISEHVFGGIKRALNGGYFLLRGRRKVTGEYALLCIASNLQRGFNILGFEKMMAAMG